MWHTLHVLMAVATLISPTTPSRFNFAELQLAGCNTDCGRVELGTNPEDSSGDSKRQWGFICSPAWSMNEANVVCRSLGFDKAFGSMPTYGGGVARPVVLRDVTCKGSEASLAECSYTEVGPDTDFAGAECGADSAVGVSCLTEIDGGLLDPAVMARANATVTRWKSATAHRLEEVASTWFSPLNNAATEVAKEKEVASTFSSSSSSSPPCTILEGVPLPFAPAQVEKAYVMKDRITELFAGMETDLWARLCEPKTGLRIQKVLVDLVARGLRWNAIGLDMSRANMTALEKALVHTLYLKHNTHGELHFELDHPLRSKITSSPSMLIPPPPLASSADNVDVGEVTVAASGSANAIEGKIDDRSRSRSSNTAEDGNDALSPTEEELYATLQRDGILQVDNFGLGDEMLEKLSAIATSTMEASPTDPLTTSIVSSGAIITVRLPLPDAVDYLLSANTTVTKILQSYLGEDTTLHGYKLTKLSTVTKRDVSDYVASRWHHDRVGRRIKLFIYLHNVDCDRGHPTQVALGSQNTEFYRTEEFATSRYRDDYIAAEYTVAKGCGKRGGGFMFDTHMIHKGTAEGKDTRTTVIAEYHNALKCPAVKVLGLPIPCPSGDQHMLHKPIIGFKHHPVYHDEL